MTTGKVGTCHICGRDGPLSYEHVPPRKAFNEHKAFIYDAKELFGSDDLPWDFSGKRRTQLQRGFGAYTLCERCNNRTGSWYGAAFVDFIHQGYRALSGQLAKGKDEVAIVFSGIYPLRVIKQVVTMFFSVNAPVLSGTHPDLQAFVLDRQKKGLSPERYGIYMYALRGAIRRYIGMAGILSVPTGQTRILSEISAPPFGFVLEFDPGDRREGCDVVFFANGYDFGETATIEFTVPVYEANTPFPVDFRNRKQVLEDYLINRQLAGQGAEAQQEHNC